MGKWGNRAFKHGIPNKEGFKKLFIALDLPFILLAIAGLACTVAGVDEPAAVALISVVPAAINILWRAFVPMEATPLLLATNRPGNTVIYLLDLLGLGVTIIYVFCNPFLNPETWPGAIYLAGLAISLANDIWKTTMKSANDKEDKDKSVP